MRRIPLLILGIALLAGTATWFLRPTAVRTQSAGELAFETEFSDGKEKMSYEETRKAAQAIMNCYFNKAIQAQMEQGNAKYAAAVKTQEYPGDPPSERDIQCDVFEGHPIAERMFNELKATLAAIPQNQTQVGEKKQPNPKRGEIKPCNFESLDKASKLLSPAQDIDYFAEKRKETVSPTYAAYTVGHCYQLFYFKYLENWFVNGDGMALGIPSEGDRELDRTDSSQTEEWVDTKARRQFEYEKERQKAEQAFEHAVQTVDTLSKTYPLHVRYAQLTEHSKEVRDQIRRFRVAMDQLVYKLINQTTPNQ